MAGKQGWGQRARYLKHMVISGKPQKVTLSSKYTLRKMISSDCKGSLMRAAALTLCGLSGVLRIYV